MIQDFNCQTRFANTRTRFATLELDSRTLELDSQLSNSIQDTIHEHSNSIRELHSKVSNWIHQHSNSIGELYSPTPFPNSIGRLVNTHSQTRLATPVLYSRIIGEHSFADSICNIYSRTINDHNLEGQRSCFSAPRVAVCSLAVAHKKQAKIDEITHRFSQEVKNTLVTILNETMGQTPPSSSRGSSSSLPSSSDVTEGLFTIL